MQYNVSQLLKAPIGAVQEKVIDEDISAWQDDLGCVSPAAGMVRLLRTDAGILVQGRIGTTIRLTCSRCLAEFVVGLQTAVEEEFRASGQFATDHRTSDEAADPALQIDDQHTLDLREVVRQQLLLALPLHPVCRPECAGLCSQCGQDLNDGPCGCTREEDPRWSALREMQLAGLSEEGVD
jgi:uncharacterized protein